MIRRSRPSRTLASLMAALLLGTACDGAATGPDGSTHLTWRVEEAGTGRVTTTVIEIDRPYRARLRTFEGDGATGRLLDGTIWTEDGVHVITPDGTVQTAQRTAPGPPGIDLRLDVVVPFAVEQGLAVVDGTDELAGRPCTVVLTAAPLDAATPAPVTADEEVRSCVDEAGRLLADTWTIDGEVIRQRTAVGIEDGPPLTDDLLFGDGPVPAPTDLAGTRVLALEGPFDVPLALPIPAELLGLPLDRVAEVRDEPRTGEVVRPVRLVQRATYTDGERLLVLDQIRVVTGPALPAPPAGLTVEVPPLVGARLAPDLAGLVLIGSLGDVRVELRGALTAADVPALDLGDPARASAVSRSAARTLRNDRRVA